MIGLSQKIIKEKLTIGSRKTRDRLNFKMWVILDSNQ